MLANKYSRFIARVYSRYSWKSLAGREDEIGKIIQRIKLGVMCGVGNDKTDYN